MTCQAGPGLAPTTAPPTLLSPFISQTAALPSSFCQRMSAVPLPLKSPAIFADREPPGLCPDGESSTAILTCQAGPGLAPTTALFKTLAPSSSQTAARPSSFCQIMSDLPSPLTSSAPLMCHEVPGLLPTALPDICVAPFISQTAARPSSFCHRMSDFPSALKSPASFTCQVGPGLAPTALPESSAVPFISQIAG